MEGREGRCDCGGEEGGEEGEGCRCEFHFAGVVGFGLEECGWVYAMKRGLMKDQLWIKESVDRGDVVSVYCSVHGNGLVYILAKSRAGLAYHVLFKVGSG